MPTLINFIFIKKKLKFLRETFSQKPCKNFTDISQVRLNDGIRRSMTDTPQPPSLHLLNKSSTTTMSMIVNGKKRKLPSTKNNINFDHILPKKGHQHRSPSLITTKNISKNSNTITINNNVSGGRDYMVRSCQPLSITLVKVNNYKNSHLSTSDK